MKSALVTNVMELLDYSCREFHGHKLSRPGTKSSSAYSGFSAKNELWELNHERNKDALARIACLLKVSAFWENEKLGILYRLVSIESEFKDDEEVKKVLAEIRAALAEE